MNLNFDSYSINKSQYGNFVKQILSATFDSVHPYIVVKEYLQKNPIPNSKRVFAFGLGKAAIDMTQAIADEISLTDALVITKHASISRLKIGTVILGNHPIPNKESLKAGVMAKKFLSQLTKDDLLICLISGGGSSLMTLPTIPLSELKKIVSSLLVSGANIDEINTVRKHLDDLKGGGLLQFTNNAKVVSLILSDVVSDSIQTIASGITAPDSTSIDDAVKILEKHNLKNDNLIWKETLKPNDTLFANVENKILASNFTALEFACSQSTKLGKSQNFQTKIIHQNLQGEASKVGKQITQQFKTELQRMKRPFCLLAGGETTVTVKGNGKGGRNQELVLSAVETIAGIDNIFLISIASDGEDGPTDAAGAVVTGETYQRSKRLGMDVANYKSRNDAYHFFEKLGDLIKTGPSGTNVNDFVFCFAF